MKERLGLLIILAGICFILGMVVGEVILLQIKVNQLIIMAGR